MKCMRIDHDYLTKPINRSLSRVITFFVSLLILFLSANAVFFIPGIPVPFTLQVLSVLLISIFVEFKIGFLTFLTYVILGGLGLPLFANLSGGIAYFLGLTGGYIIGFIGAFLVIKLFSKKIENKLVLLLSGLFIIYFIGWLWLGILLKGNLIKSLIVGVLPFFPYDILKLLLVYFIWKRVKK
ncbi:biotin transporter BioY [bacterium]|nr:biotin transporter BioY [bacterium]